MAHISKPCRDLGYTLRVHPLAHGLIRILEVIFAIGGLVCLLVVIPATAYRLFFVLFEPKEEEHGPESQPPVRRS